MSDDIDWKAEFAFRSGLVHRALLAAINLRAEVDFALQADLVTGVAEPLLRDALAKLEAELIACAAEVEDRAQARTEKKDD